MASFEYGPDGARIAKLSPSGKRIYADADHEVGPSGTAIHYPHADIKIDDGVTTWLHRDHLKSVRLVTDASGNPVEQSVYTAYGDRQGPSALSPTKGYIGERHDPGEVERENMGWDPCFSTERASAGQSWVLP